MGRTAMNIKTAVILTFALLALTNLVKARACPLPPELAITPAHRQAEALRSVRSGDVEARGGYYEFAVNCYFASTYIEPSFGRPYRGAEETILAGTDRQEVLRDLNNAVQENPNDPYALAVRAIIKIDMGDRQGAELDFTRSLALKGDLLFSRQGRAENRIFGGLDLDALEDCNALLKITRNNPRTLLDRGMFLARHNQPAAAMADYDAALRERPNWSRPYIMKSELYSAYGQHAAAAKLLDLAIHNEPTLGASYRKRAIERRCLGDLKGAVDDLNMAILYQPEQSDLIDRALLKLQLGDCNGAVTDLMK